MTTRNSPLKELQAQADKIAATLKSAERGESPIRPSKDRVKFGIVMDDKIITMDMLWETVRESSEAALSAFILRYMREQRETLQ